MTKEFETLDTQLDKQVEEKINKKIEWKDPK